MAQDPIEALFEAHDELDQLTQEFGSAADAARHPLTEYDRTGTVTVDLDEDGVLQKVKIAGGWNRHYRPEELGGAVQEALIAASTARAQGWGQKFAEQREPSVRPAPLFTTELGARLDAAQARGVDTDAALRELRDLLRQIHEAVDEVSDQAAAHVAAEYTGRSSSGHVRASVSGAGDLLTLDFEQPWVETAHPTNLGREATEAIDAAHRQRGNTGVADLVATSALGDAGRLSRDPIALAERLKLI